MDMSTTLSTSMIQKNSTCSTCSLGNSATEKLPCPFRGCMYSALPSIYNTIPPIITIHAILAKEGS